MGWKEKNEESVDSLDIGEEPGQIATVGSLDQIRRRATLQHMDGEIELPSTQRSVTVSLLPWTGNHEPKRLSPVR